jgi:uncharacterized membrane protein
MSIILFLVIMQMWSLQKIKQKKIRIKKQSFLLKARELIQKLNKQRKESRKLRRDTTISIFFIICAATMWLIVRKNINPSNLSANINIQQIDPSFSITALAPIAHGKTYILSYIIETQQTLPSITIAKNWLSYLPHRIKKQPHNTDNNKTIIGFQVDGCGTYDLILNDGFSSMTHQTIIPCEVPLP